MSRHVRVGLIVPSSNITMETEVPALLRARMEVDPSVTFTTHSSRVRLRHVTREELAQMVSDSDRCAIELADARVDVMAYACLVALMAQGPGFFEQAEERLERTAAGNGSPAPVVSSAGALVRSIRALGASRVVLVAPYLRPITETVVHCIADAGVDVVDWETLEVADNLEVGRLDQRRLPEIAEGLDRSRADAVVLSACVQMPSLGAIEEAERRLGMPALSAATATTFEMLARLGLETRVPHAGHLLSGEVRPLDGFDEVPLAGRAGT
jgi:maleate isomerase